MAALHQRRSAPLQKVRVLSAKAGENGNAYAKREMDQRYGKGKWKRKGRQGHEYSELKKWADRGYRYKKRR